MSKLCKVSFIGEWIIKEDPGCQSERELLGRVGDETFQRSSTCKESGKVEVRFFFFLFCLVLLQLPISAYERPTERRWVYRKKNWKLKQNQNGNEKSCISHDKIIIISHRCRFTFAIVQDSDDAERIDQNELARGIGVGGFVFWRVIFHF